MSELGSILDLWRCSPGQRGDMVLATVVHVRGSAYRRPGARMLLLENGARIGTISGGCLEADVARRAWWWTEAGATVRIFDNTVEDAARDFGLGCNGVITVLLERVATPAAHGLLEFLDAQHARREAAIVATVVRGGAGGALPVGARWLFDADAKAMQPVAEALDALVQTTRRERRSRLVHLPDADVFVEWVPPPQRLFVFGAGQDAVPLVDIASMMGWSVTVSDFHLSSLQATRFPSAERLVPLRAGSDADELGIGPGDAVVVMTHNYPRDSDLVPRLLAARPCYLGLLGPRDRSVRMFEEIGADLEQEFIHAPVGLDIGGDQPPSIALAIAAEIQCVLSGQTGQRLRDRNGAIHSPALELGASAQPLADVPAPIAAACGSALG
jgi:xanthine dehydrogenase accessory factor